MSNISPTEVRELITNLVGSYSSTHPYLWNAQAILSLAELSNRALSQTSHTSAWQCSHRQHPLEVLGQLWECSGQSRVKASKTILSEQLQTEKTRKIRFRSVALLECVIFKEQCIYYLRQKLSKLCCMKSPSTEYPPFNPMAKGANSFKGMYNLIAHLEIPKKKKKIIPYARYQTPPPSALLLVFFLINKLY